MTARMLLDKDDISKADRQLAKSAGFGLTFGLSPNGYRNYARASWDIDLTEEQARYYHGKFFQAYPAIARWHALVRIRRMNETRTPWGRRRLMDQTTPDTIRINTPVQGTEADGMKGAMALLWETRHTVPGAFPVLMVHDCLVVECDPSQREAVENWLRSAMVRAMQPLLGDIPCGVDVHSGQRFKEEPPKPEKTVQDCATQAISPVASPEPSRANSAVPAQPECLTMACKPDFVVEPVHRIETHGGKLACGDCLQVLASLSPNSVNLVFGSPSYEDARTYGIDYSLSGQEWVDWMVRVFQASLRVCNGLVAILLEGRTRYFRWSAVPALLMADLHRAGIHLRKPLIFHRCGIPGSGGKDWLRNDYEFILCATRDGRLPWADPTACGRPPKYKPGGAMSYRQQDGSRKGKKTTARGYKAGDTDTGEYKPPALANPGNVIKCSVGGGRMGSAFAHENEAPFPLELAEFFVKSFCPTGGVVCDPFLGSGTTAHAAVANQRQFIGIDIRQSQIDLTLKRLASLALHETPEVASNTA
jgi:DNA modification methylase